MKNSFSLEILKTQRSLDQQEQALFRNSLRHLLKLEGIQSMCLEERELYIEYNPKKFSLESFKAVLLDIGFPLRERMAFTTFHISA